MTSRAEVSHPVVVSQATHGDAATALSAGWALVHLVVLVQRRPSFAALKQNVFKIHVRGSGHILCESENKKPYIDCQLND